MAIEYVLPLRVNEHLITGMHILYFCDRRLATPLYCMYVTSVIHWNALSTAMSLGPIQPPLA